jgi:hypothetical protein
MKTLILGILAMLLIIWSMRNDNVTTKRVIEGFEPVQASSIQSTINAIRENDSNIYPIDTVYYNDNKDGTQSARFMFYNTQTHNATQYDVNIDKSGVPSIIPNVSHNTQNPFMGTVDHEKYSAFSTKLAPLPDMEKIYTKYSVH